MELPQRPRRRHGHRQQPGASSRAPPSTYDPFGQPSAPPPDNSAGNFDYGWLGQHQRPLEHAGTLATIEMGARQYVPSIGRFLEVDPVEGGSCNDYDYVCGDPVNGFDLNGLKKEQRPIPVALGAPKGECHYSAANATFYSDKCYNYSAAVRLNDPSVYWDFVDKGIDYYAPQGPIGADCSQEVKNASGLFGSYGFVVAFGQVVWNHEYRKAWNTVVEEVLTSSTVPSNKYVDAFASGVDAACSL